MLIQNNIIKLKTMKLRDFLITIFIIIIFSLCFVVYNYSKIIGDQDNRIQKQQTTIDSLKVEVQRIDSVLKAWDKEYQENLDMSNDLVKELEKYENN